MLTFDMSSFERMAKKIGVAQQQLPFALSRSLNESAFATRSALIQDWPKHVTARNPSFIGWALGVRKSTKADLSVTINDERAQGRGHLALHADGGMKPAKGRLAIPGRNVKWGRHGVVSTQRPKNLKNKFVKNGKIYVVTGRGKRKTIKRMYVLASSARIKKDVPLRETFRASMIREMNERAPRLMLEAMRTAIRR